MFRYNDPLEAADLRKNMSEKSRKASLMNQSLMSQSLSDLRHPPGCRNSGEWRMFSSDSDIKDIIAEGEVGGAAGSQESIDTLKYTSAQVKEILRPPRHDQCCGSVSGILCLFDPWIRDPE
jgi:hypothetical protein